MMSANDYNDIATACSAFKNQHLSNIVQELAISIREGKHEAVQDEALMTVLSETFCDCDFSDNEKKAPVGEEDVERKGDMVSLSEVLLWCERLIPGATGILSFSAFGRSGSFLFQFNKETVNNAGKQDTSDDEVAPSDMSAFFNSQSNICRLMIQVEQKSEIITFSETGNVRRTIFDNARTNLFPDSANAVVNALDDLFKKSCDATRERELQGDLAETFLHGLVKTDPDKFNLRDEILSLSPATKSRCLLVAGESGSGKSWYATHGIKHALHSGAGSILYYELTQEDEISLATNLQDNVPTEVSRAISLFMKCTGSGSPGSLRRLLFEELEEASEKLQKDRNEKAKYFFDKTMNELVSRNEIVKKWWHVENPPKIKNLTIVIDECGKSPRFVRSMIQLCRNLYAELRVKAASVKIVLVGTRLDAWKTLRPVFTHGTNPFKFFLLRMTVPDKSLLKQIGIDSADLEGAISHALADNARMLMRALVPTLTSPALTQHFYNWGVETAEGRRRNARVHAGSDSSLMGFAARLYFVQNGVSDLQNDPIKRYQVFLSLFHLFLRRSFVRLESDTSTFGQLWSPEASQLIGGLPLINREFMEHILSKGLALHDESSIPSKAMEYLACDGERLPVTGGEGIKFEKILVYHLRRYHEILDERCPKKYTLAAAWAPPVRTNPATSYSHPTLTPEHEQDLDSICDLLEVESLDRSTIIINQSSKNAEGPDVLSLSVHRQMRDAAVLDENSQPGELQEGEKRTDSISAVDIMADNGKSSQLHLEISLGVYQNKNYSDAKQVDLADAFASLGVGFGGKAVRVPEAEGVFEPFEVQQGTPSMFGKAGYCDSFIKALLDGVVKKILAKFVQKVSIGTTVRRVVAVTNNCAEMSIACRNNTQAEATRPIQLTKNGKIALAVRDEKNISVWTKEFMSPTLWAVKFPAENADDMEEVTERMAASEI